MKRDVSKLCADSLRAFAKNSHGIHLKAAHAHELVAAYFGYRSKNALLADAKYPISNLVDASIVVMVPDAFIDQRRLVLLDLSRNLPSSRDLGEGVYGALFQDQYWKSEYPPFLGFETLAKVLVESSDSLSDTFKLRGRIPMHHVVSVNDGEDAVILDVVHSDGSDPEMMNRDRKTKITLPRVAGRIGFAKPEIAVTGYTGGMRKSLRSLGISASE